MLMKRRFQLPTVFDLLIILGFTILIILIQPYYRQAGDSPTENAVLITYEGDLPYWDVLSLTAMRS